MMQPRSVISILLTAFSLALAGSALALDSGDRSPEIGLNDLRGNAVTLESLRGKVVIVDFWASWCEPCREEMPVLDRLYRDNRERGLVVIGVSVDNGIDNVRTFLRRNAVSFPIVHDAEHEVAERFEPSRMPSSYLIDRRGMVRYVHEGFEAEDATTITREVATLLGERAPTKRGRTKRR